MCAEFVRLIAEYFISGYGRLDYYVQVRLRDGLHNQGTRLGTCRQYPGKPIVLTLGCAVFLVHMSPVCA
jgi:hypothetical protein